MQVQEINRRPHNTDIDVRVLPHPPSLLQDFHQLKGEARIYPNELIAVYEPYSAAFLNLYAVYQQLLKRSERLQISVASLEPGHGASFVAANLAVIFSQHGYSTLLVDGNPYRPRQHRIFGVDLDRILEDSNSDSDLMQPMRVSDFRSLSILPIREDQNIYTLRQSWKNALQSSSEQFEVILSDSPSFQESDEALAHATMMSGVLLVLRTGHVRRNELSRAKESIELAGGTLLGAVMVNF